ASADVILERARRRREIVRRGVAGDPHVAGTVERDAGGRVASGARARALGSAQVRRKEEMAAARVELRGERVGGAAERRLKGVEDRKVQRRRLADDVRLAGAVDGDRGAGVVQVAEEVRRVGERGSARVDLRDERVATELETRAASRVLLERAGRGRE